MWVKQGRVFNLEPAEWRTTHAQVPTPFVFRDRIRVYYACRTKENKSFPAYFDLSKDLKTVLRVHETPVMERGKPGMFDADGVMPSCVIRNDDELWMYHIGWNSLRGDLDNSGARYQNEIGLAVSKDNGETFERMFDGPIMGRSPTEPGLAVMPFVKKSGSLYEMHYQSGTGWHKIGDKYEPTYVIKYAESLDGVHWVRNCAASIKLSDKFSAQSRPWLVGNRMWYCERGCVDYRKGADHYMISCAESEEGIVFKRNIDGGSHGQLTMGKEGEFDSRMQCYPAVIECDEQLIMFYNGNDFGQTGIGVAIWNS